MGPVLQDSYHPLSEQEIADFEVELGQRLPEDYRAFLLAHNGGYFHQQVCEAAGFVEEVYGLNLFEDESGSDLRSTWRDPHRMLPAGMIEIARAMGDSLICLALSVHEQPGSIWIVDPEIEKARRRLGLSFYEYFRLVDFDKVHAPWPNESDMFFVAIESGDLAALRRELRDHQQLERVNHLGWTPLHAAVRYAQPAVIVELLNLGADREGKGTRGFTPLYDAVYCQCMDIVNLLLDHGADINARSDKGLTALQMAVSDYRYNTAQLLIERGADLTGAADVAPDGRIPKLIRGAEAARQRKAKIGKFRMPRLTPITRQEHVCNFAESIDPP